ncbi:uncharacterized protein L203_105496 [Cryptococcus depauperatus CBS 7841]|uniref:Uncharacterized protein n=1 Tax=Cryptococcus depauperatus CBS 7841 TaxID=1295531 RepID=A0AAJ8JXI8_9TREE
MLPNTYPMQLPKQDEPFLSAGDEEKHDTLIQQSSVHLTQARQHHVKQRAKLHCSPSPTYSTQQLPLSCSSQGSSSTKRHRTTRGIHR